MNSANLLMAMDTKELLKIIIPIAAIILVLIILIIIIRAIVVKRRRTEAEKTLGDRELVSSNSAAFEALIVLAQNNEEYIGELKNLQEEIKFLAPMDDSKVIGYDKKIRNLIGDLRIALTKSEGDESKKTKEILLDLKLAVADRKASAGI